MDPRRSMTGARWALNEVAEARVTALSRATGLSDPAARVLALRFDGDDRAERWLAPSFDHLHDPLAMRNMDAALDRLRSAVRRKEKIRVVTDYDVDGTTSSLILQAALRAVEPNVDVSWHIPSRFGEGYGFSTTAAQQAASDGVGLVVTADIGVRDHAAVAEARQRGVDVLICDHHLPAGASVPEGATVLCPPQQGDAYPNRSLAACGVSLKVAQALLRGHPKGDRIVQSMLKLAAIGTVADMVSLGTLENRAIVALGLQQLNQGQHTPGLQALIDVCRLNGAPIDESAVGYRLGPRINAAGRVADAGLVVELLGTRDPEAAHELARRIDALNTERRDIQRRLVDDALVRIGDAPDPFVVLSGQESEGWHRGVVGIAAARIKDHVNRPVAVVAVQGDLAVGSVRSVPSVHAVRALESVSDLLLKFGGHPAAAGFTVRTADLDALRARLGQYVAQTVPDGELVPLRQADVVIEADRIEPRLHGELSRLGPFGMGNPSPTLWVPAVRPFGVQVKGASGSLLKFLVSGAGGRAVEAVWWDASNLAEAVQSGPVDLLASLGENVWNGERRLQLEVVDARAA